MFNEVHTQTMNMYEVMSRNMKNDHKYLWQEGSLTIPLSVSRIFFIILFEKHIHVYDSFIMTVRDPFNLYT